MAVASALPCMSCIGASDTLGMMTSNAFCAHITHTVLSSLIKRCFEQIGEFAILFLTYDHFCFHAYLDKPTGIDTDLSTKQDNPYPPTRKRILCGRYVHPTLITWLASHDQPY